MNARLICEFVAPFETSASFGMGKEACGVETALSELQTHALASVALGKAKQDALNSLYSRFCEGSRTGWDGYEASPASYESYVRARQFIEALPTDFPVPEVGLDPDGEVSLE